eukprot:gene5681-6382_t
MPGRGRGKLLDEVLQQEYSKTTTKISEQNACTNLDQKLPSTPLSELLSSGASEKCLQSSGGGRGLMTPSCFMKPSINQPAIVGNLSKSKNKLDHLTRKEATFIDVTYQPPPPPVNEEIACHVPPLSVDKELAYCPPPPPELDLKITPKKDLSLQRVINQSDVHAMSGKNCFQKKKTQGSSPFTTESLSKIQSSDNSKVTTTEQADNDWKIFNFKRKINQLLSKITEGDLDEVIADLVSKIEGNAISQKFSQNTQWELVIETLIETSIKSDKSIELTSHIIQKVAEHDIFNFKVTFPRMVMAKINEFVKVSASDHAITSPTKRLCKLLGCLFTAPVSKDNGFHSVILSCIQFCVEKWTYPDGIGDEFQGFQINKAETHANALKELFNQISSGEFKQDRATNLMDEMTMMLELIKESILNNHLPRTVREVYLDAMLINARWYQPGQSSKRNTYTEKVPSQGAVVNSEQFQDVDDDNYDNYDDYEHDERDDINETLRRHENREKCKDEEEFGQFEERTANEEKECVYSSSTKSLRQNTTNLSPSSPGSIARFSAPQFKLADAPSQTYVSNPSQRSAQLEEAPTNTHSGLRHIDKGPKLLGIGRGGNYDHSKGLRQVKVSNSSSTKSLKFDGIPPGCVSCGSTGHFANDCTNSAVFFGQ